MSIQKLIIKNLLQNKKYGKAVAPHLKKIYFEKQYQILFSQIIAYVKKYNSLPTKDALLLAIQESKYADAEKKAAIHSLDDLFAHLDINQSDEWLIVETEKWVKNRSLTLAIFECVDIIEGRSKDQTIEAMPNVMKNALNVDFKVDVGHEYFDHGKERYEFYHGKNQTMERIPFRLTDLNIATNNGCETQSLNVIIGGTGGGKTLTMCSLASDFLRDGHNVLYLTLEMAAVKIAQRIDANLMDCDLNEIKNMRAEEYEDNLSRIQSKTDGRIFIKQYPTVGTTDNHIIHLIEELKIKRDFTPKVIFVDYLNLMASSRLRADADNYNKNKAVAEELRAIATEQNICIWSATQTNRQGFKKSDIDAEDTSESFGIPFTADFMISIYADEDMVKQNKLLIKQASKNRYEDINLHPKFFVGCDRPKMKLYNLNVIE